MSETSTEQVTLRCPRCKRKASMARDFTDPVGTAVVEYLCPKCNPSGFESITYYDAAGKVLVP